MLWYKDGESGVGRAVYSGVVEPTNTLWVYLYVCQHDRLWLRGKVPAGEQFLTIKRVVVNVP